MQKEIKLITFNCSEFFRTVQTVNINILTHV